MAEARNRSVRVKNLPPAIQEGLLQQAFEKIIPIKRLEVFLDKQEAVVELENPAVCTFGSYCMIASAQLTAFVRTLADCC